MQDASPENSPAVESPDASSPGPVAVGSPDSVVAGSPDPTTPPDRRSPVSARTAPPPRRRPDFSTAPIAGRDLAIIVLQLALATILVWQFELEQPRYLLAGMLAALVGFLVNVHLPAPFRPAWFLAVSVGVLVGVLGWSDGLFAIAVAGSLIAATAIPIPLMARAGVILLLGAIFTWLRSKSAAAYWPVVGSMFMFRMISYLDAARKKQAPRTLVETAGYFLMLPNSLFPLFPVVDAKVFRDTWYNDEPRTIYQTGVHWIAAGILHLVLYRLIKYEMLPSPLAVHTLSDVLLYLAANYALYLRVSGRFHIICGMLHLFGWNLPRTHDHYFLAASFSEIWRRINIYWKDFMMKTFFYPAYFRIRTVLPGQGVQRDQLAIGIGVMWVFFWTWLAHSWQTFWLIGLFPFRLSDGWMWLAVGALVAGNAILDYRRALLPRKKDDPISWPAAVLRSLQIMTMFLLVSLFWAAWTNVETLRYMLHIATSQRPPAGDVAWILACSVGILLTLATGHWLLERRRTMSPAAQTGPWFERQAALHVIVMGVIVVLCVSGGPLDFVGRAGVWVRHLQRERLRPGEAMAIVDGYYEQLATANSQGSPFLGNDRQRPASQGDLFSSMLRPRNDLLGFELIPGWRGVFSGNPLTINRWGMRDPDRTLEKPEGVVRIAFLGSSVVMGYGVKDDETMTQRLEQMLNANSNGVRYEVLNFGSGRYYAVHRRLLLENKVLAFRPDLIVNVAHQDELRAAGLVSSALIDGQPLDDDCLQNCVTNARIQPDDSSGVISSKLTLETLSILQCTYNRVARTCREKGLGIEFIYLPIPGEYEYPIDPKIVIDMARDAGMSTHDMSDWWGPGKTSSLVVPDTQHPTAAGQQQIAERLRRALEPAIEAAKLKAQSPAS